MNRKKSTINRISVCLLLVVMLMGSAKAFTHDIFGDLFTVVNIQTTLVFDLGLDDGDPDEPVGPNPPDEPPPVPVPGE